MEKKQCSHVKSKVNSTSTHLIISALHRVDFRISEKVELMKKLMIDLETLVLHICKMKAEKFVSCINKYMLATRYDVEDYKVCELINEKIVSILNPEYFGIYSNKMRIDHLKKYYIKNIIKNWKDMETEDQELVFVTFC